MTMNKTINPIFTSQELKYLRQLIHEDIKNTEINSIENEAHVQFGLQLLRILQNHLEDVKQVVPAPLTKEKILFWYNVIFNEHKDSLDNTDMDRLQNYFYD